MKNVTIFKSIKDTSAPFYRSVEYIIHRIREGKSKDIVKRIREEKDKDKRNLIKKELPAICFSGEFTRREDSALVNHSGVICLDFDGFAKKSDMLAKKDEFTKDKYTLSVFISPSGDGLKLLVKIPADENKHKTYFKALEKYYNCEQFDKTSKNISRVCYESYDPLIYHNPDSKEWDKLAEEEFEPIERPANRKTITVTDQNEIIRRLRMWWDREYGIVVGENLPGVGIGETHIGFAEASGPCDSAGVEHSVPGAAARLAVAKGDWARDGVTRYLGEVALAADVEVLVERQTRSVVDTSVVALANVGSGVGYVGGRLSIGGRALR